MKRGSHAQAVDRISEVFRMLRSGVTRFDLIRIGTENWGVSVRQVEKYITRANKMIDNYALQNREEFLKDACTKLDILYVENYLARDRRECRRILLAKNRLLGFERLHIDITGISVDDILENLRDSDLNKKSEKRNKRC